ncbi:hypothetical protein GGC65_001027 [Sphingopyxis sp. OAS728]|uniref:hypothetical protein n=1 Tax=Sphingopyxis sp. OAS728 TaxID=2663823 RepID=UPI00178BF12A|nr:hypothetical protein [Sphingopyxis sp. OAS728]MBE1526571.1 hypothetical protein [Sphingopyxis sp. OAS728]
MSELVREIVEVNASIDGDEENPLLVVEVEGLAATAGWTNVRLEPHVTITPPDDGVLDFDLVGDRPSDAAEVLSEVEAAWEGALEDWCIGVRVHGIDNLIEDEIFEPWDEDDESEAA